MKNIKTLHKLDVCDRVASVTGRIQTVCLLLANVDYLEESSNNVSTYSMSGNVHEDLISLCMSELLSAADVLNTLHENCREYEVAKNETE